MNAYPQEAFILGSEKASALRKVTNLVFQRVLIGQHVMATGRPINPVS
jgi:hypothetical protein